MHPDLEAMPLDPAVKAKLRACSPAQRAYALAKAALQIAKEGYENEWAATPHDPEPDWKDCGQTRTAQTGEQWKALYDTWAAQWGDLMQSIYEKHRVYEREQLLFAAERVLVEWTRDTTKAKIGAARFKQIADAFDAYLDPDRGLYGELRQKLLDICMTSPAG